MNTTPGTLFTKLHFLRKLRISPISYVLLYTRLERLATDKHSSLLDPFVSYEENEVLWIRPLFESRVKVYYPGWAIDPLTNLNLGSMSWKFLCPQPGKSNWRGRLSTVDLLVLTSLDQLLLTLKVLFTFFTKQPTIMRRSTVLKLPPQLVFPASSIHLYINPLPCDLFNLHRTGLHSVSSI